MRRREFISLLGSAAVAWPLSAHAEEPTIRVVGFLHIASAKPYEGVVTAFRQGLKEAGYTEGQNVKIEFRWADGDYSRLPSLAAELVRLQAAVIVTGGGDAPVMAAKVATNTTPIVFNVGTDPVKSGLVAGLSRPGGNITGTNILTSELATKRVGLLHDLVPSAPIIAHLVNPDFATTEANVKEVQTAAHLLGLKVVLLKASNGRDIEAAFASMREQHLRALLVGSDPFFNSLRDRFVGLAARDAIATIYEQREFATAGGLMSYGTSLTDAYRLMGNYTGRILNGEKPANLPVIQSAKFELVINLKAAKALGLTVSPGLLSAADEVIE